MDELDVPYRVIKALLDDGTEISTMMWGHAETVLSDYMRSLRLRARSDTVVAIKFPEGVLNFDEDVGIKDFFPRVRAVHLPSTLERLTNRLFLGCEDLRDINIPARIKKIPEGCFANCKKLRHIDLPSNLERISERAFARSGLEAIKIPAKVKKIGILAFLSCTNLERVIFADARTCELQIIKYGAFHDTPKLRRIRIPPSVELIDRRAFGISGMNVIYFEGRSRSELASLFPVLPRDHDSSDEEWRVEPADPPAQELRRFSFNVKLVLCDNQTAFRDDEIKHLQFPFVDLRNYGVLIPPGFDTLGSLLARLRLLNDRELAAANSHRDESIRDMVQFFLRDGIDLEARRWPTEIQNNVLDQRPNTLWFDI